LALFKHTRVSTATWRGGLTYLAVLLVARWGFAALLRARSIDEANLQEEESAG
jgi:hypothetical protein